MPISIGKAGGIHGAPPASENEPPNTSTPPGERPGTASPEFMATQGRCFGAGLWNKLSDQLRQQKKEMEQLHSSLDQISMDDLHPDDRTRLQDRIAKLKERAPLKLNQALGANEIKTLKEDTNKLIDDCKASKRNFSRHQKRSEAEPGTKAATAEEAKAAQNASQERPSPAFVKSAAEFFDQVSTRVEKIVSDNAGDNKKFKADFHGLIKTLRESLGLTKDCHAIWNAGLFSQKLDELGEMLTRLRKCEQASPEHSSTESGAKQNYKSTHETLADYEQKLKQKKQDALDQEFSTAEEGMWMNYVQTQLNMLVSALKEGNRIAKSAI